jgi:hypothetical protein
MPLDAASEKGKGVDAKTEAAPPKTFDWNKFFREKNETKKADSKKVDWDTFFQSMKNDTQESPQKFSWDKFIQTLTNRTKEQKDTWKTGAVQNRSWDWLQDLDEEDEDLNNFEKAAPCNYGYEAYRGGCYKISRETGTFTQCQKICEDDGGSLAAITDDWMDEFLWKMVQFSGGTAQYGTYVGLYHDINSQSYTGEWVDGSSMSYTNFRGEEEPLEGNLGCATSSCATMIPSCYWCEDDPGRPRYRGWDQIRCIREQHCLCEHERSPSSSYLKSVSTLDWPEFLTSAQPMYFRLGWLCVILLVWALVGTLLVTRRASSHPRARKYLNVTMGNDPTLKYGELLNTRGGDVESLVHSWIVRGGVAATAYGAMLLVLAFTTMMQNGGTTVRIFINAFEAFLMFACKATVGLSAFFVHTHLSTTSRAIAGPWVLILSVSKMAMALGQLLITFGYLHIAITYQVCEALSLFIWSCMISVVFQGLAGFSLFRVYYRTVRRVGDREVFSRVVGCWWSALVGSTFGVGIGLWWCGAEFLTDADLGLAAMPLILMITAACQLTAGLSMLRANEHIRGFFKSPEGKAAFAEMTEQVRADPSGRELRTRVGRSAMAVDSDI